MRIFLPFHRVMSARSPRGSLSGGSDIAGDFEDSLRDLARNDKYEISNLTLVAKECTENAQAISRALENHIRMVRRCSSYMCIRHLSFTSTCGLTT